SGWKELVTKVSNLTKNTDIGIVGKYVELPDAYLSVVESLKHAGFAYDTDINIHWINSENLTAETIKEELANVDGIVVPGGFGSRCIDGKMEAIRYARENIVLILCLCLGIPLVIVEFALNVHEFSEANSTEFNSTTPHPVIDLLPEQNEFDDIEGTFRLGNNPCYLKENTKFKAA